VTVAVDTPIDSDELAFYETIFAVCCLATAAIIGELRGIETAGRLRAQELSRRTIVGEDEVRRHVADFIHDGPVQELIGLDLILQGAVRATERGDGGRATELIAQARELAEGNVRALRDEIVNLGPYAFEELSFEIAVERCIPVSDRENAYPAFKRVGASGRRLWLRMVRWLARWLELNLKELGGGGMVASLECFCDGPLKVLEPGSWSLTVDSPVMNDHFNHLLF